MDDGRWMAVWLFGWKRIVEQGRAGLADVRVVVVVVVVVLRDQSLRL